MDPETLGEMIDNHRELRDQVLDGAEDQGLLHLATSLCVDEGTVDSWVRALARDLEAIGVEAGQSLSIAGVAVALGCFVDRDSRLQEAIMRLATAEILGG